MKVNRKVAMDHSGNNIPCSIHPYWRLHQDVVAWHAAPRRPCKPAALAARRAWYPKERVIWVNENGLQQAFTPCIAVTGFCKLKGLSLRLGLNCPKTKVHQAQDCSVWNWLLYTLPETNSFRTLKIGRAPKRKVVFLPSIFRWKC